MSAREHPAFWPTYTAVLGALWSNNLTKWRGDDIRSDEEMILEAETVAATAVGLLGKETSS